MKRRAGMRLLNDSELKSDDWWSWSVWLDGPDEQLDQVEAVRYVLHPTFPKPVRKVKDRASRFKLESSGWGEFSIAADVQMKNGERVSLERWLTFGEAEDTPDERESGGRPTVFISSSATDRSLVEEIKKALAKQQVDVVAPDEVDAGSSWAEDLHSQVSQADVVAFLVYGELRSFAEQELSIAERSDKEIVPVSLRTGSELPRPLANRQALSLSSFDDVDAVADALASRAKNQFIEDE